MDMSVLSEFKAVAICLIGYIPKNITEKEFYYQILAESRLLLEEDKINLAFFTAFSAIDLYINYWEEYHKFTTNKNRRLKEKLKDIFKEYISFETLDEIVTILSGDDEDEEVVQQLDFLGIDKKNNEDLLNHIRVHCKTHYNSTMTFAHDHLKDQEKRIVLLIHN